MPVYGFDEAKLKTEVHTKEEVDGMVDDIKDDVLDEISPTLTQMQEDITAFEGTVNAAISGVESDVSAFEASVNTSIGSMESDITAFEGQVNTALAGKQSKHVTETYTLLYNGWVQQSTNIWTQNPIPSKVTSAITANNTVIVSPTPTLTGEGASEYARCKVAAYAQGANTLTFRASSEPTEDIDVNILILGV